jgi:ABC-type dipeptide/oligopeptide/nickel transport system permease component
MIWLLIRRTLWAIAVLWVVYTASFFLMYAVPGGPFSSERQLPPDIRRNVEARYRLDQPIVAQYFQNLAAAARFDFGPSFKLADYTVNEIIAEGFPISASLGVFALIFALSLGLTAGMVSAVWRQSWLDFSFMGAATLGIAVPNFVLASLGAIFFVFILGWFPAAGWGTLAQIVQPALWLGAPFAAYIARLTRTGMLEVLNQDYIRTAYAKGLPHHRVILVHALRGAILPVVSYLGPAIAGILTGSLVLERIFALPGMASHFLDAATQRDYTLCLGLVMVYTVLLYTMNLMVDLSYAVIDPRVKTE